MKGNGFDEEDFYITFFVLWSLGVLVVALWSIARIYPRMPVILPEQHHAAWLGETENGKLKALLLPYPATSWTNRADAKARRAMIEKLRHRKCRERLI
jgi:hypothetical protein